MTAPRLDASRVKTQVSHRPVKKAYESPLLERAGTLTEVTRGGGQNVSTDGGAVSVV